MTVVMTKYSFLACDTKTVVGVAEISRSIVSQRNGDQSTVPPHGEPVLRVPRAFLHTCARARVTRSDPTRATLACVLHVRPCSFPSWIFRNCTLSLILPCYFPFETSRNRYLTLAYSVRHYPGFHRADRVESFRTQPRSFRYVLR